MRIYFLRGVLAIHIVFVFAFQAFSQKPASAIQIKIATSAQCEMCKERIEKALAYEKGVKKSNLDLITKELTVVYNPGKTDPDKIRLAVSKTGYDADQVPAESKAYKALPPCCKKPDDPDHVGH